MAETNGKRLLVVDDANLVRRFYRDALERAGFEIEEALNGVEALEKIGLGTFDLVIVDVNMPQMDGLTFLTTLRRQPPPTSTIPAIVVSTEAGPQDKAAARSAGANFYLVKPVSQESLVQHVAILCGLAMWATMIWRSSDDDTEYVLVAEEVERLEKARYRSLEAAKAARP